MTVLGLLKLVNLSTKGRANAMGTQSCQRVSQAFLIWKRNTGIPIDYAYDNAARLQGLLAVDAILAKHMRAIKLVCFTRVLLHSHDQNQKSKDVTKMLRENAAFV